MTTRGPRHTIRMWRVIDNTRIWEGVTSRESATVHIRGEGGKVLTVTIRRSTFLQPTDSIHDKMRTRDLQVHNVTPIPPPPKQQQQLCGSADLQADFPKKTEPTDPVKYSETYWSLALHHALLARRYVTSYARKHKQESKGAIQTPVWRIRIFQMRPLQLYTAHRSWRRIITGTNISLKSQSTINIAVFFFGATAPTWALPFLHETLCFTLVF
jgi:hypothetical protein